MRILVINWQDTSHPLSGGAEVHLFEIFSRIVQKGHEVVVFCCQYEGAKRYEVMRGIHVYRQGARDTFNFLVPGAYRSLHRKYQFDVVVEDLNKIPFYGRLYIKQPRLNIVHHLFQKTIYSETSWYFATYLYLSERLIPPLYKKDRFAVVSESTKQELVGLGIPGDQISIIYNAVDHSTYRQRGLEKFNPPIVSFLGRLKRYKNVDCFIQAAKQVLQKMPDVRFLVIGEGDHRPALMRLAAELGIENRIEFTGYVDEQRKAELLERSHTVVNPSPKEGWGLTNIEANACGTPVIAANSPGLRDSVLDGQSGLLFEYNNVEELSSKIELVLKDSALRARLSDGALAWAARFNWDRSADEMLDLLEETLADKVVRQQLESDSHKDTEPQR